MTEHRLVWTGPQMTRSGAEKNTIRSLLATGHTTHSAEGQTLDFVLSYLEKERIPYELTRLPGEGTHVKIRRDIALRMEREKTSGT